MAACRMQNRRILIVEDEYLLASELAEILSEAGAVVVGPAATVRDALALITQADSLDGALLDVNLGGELVFPVADALTARQVPFVLTTGYPRRGLPARYEHVRRIEKPLEPDVVADAIIQMLMAG